MQTEDIYEPCYAFWPRTFTDRSRLLVGSHLLLMRPPNSCLRTPGWRPVRQGRNVNRVSCVSQGIKLGGRSPVSIQCPLPPTQWSLSCRQLLITKAAVLLLQSRYFWSPTGCHNGTSCRTGGQTTHSRCADGHTPASQSLGYEAYTIHHLGRLSSFLLLLLSGLALLHAAVRH